MFAGKNIFLKTKANLRKPKKVATRIQKIAILYSCNAVYCRTDASSRSGAQTIWRPEVDELRRRLVDKEFEVYASCFVVLVMFDVASPQPTPDLHIHRQQRPANCGTTARTYWLDV